MKLAIMVFMSAMLAISCDQGKQGPDQGAAPNMSAGKTGDNAGSGTASSLGSANEGGSESTKTTH